MKNHATILRILSALSPEITNHNAFFGGGTACSLLCGEYRRSDDIDFLCSDEDGYRWLRRHIEPKFFGPFPVLRIKADEYAIRCLLGTKEGQIKFKIIAEAHLHVRPMISSGIPVPVVVPEDLILLKLYANANRYADTSTNSRDLLDFGMLIWNHPNKNFARICHRIPEKDRFFIDEGLAGGLKALSDKTHFRRGSEELEMSIQDMAKARVAAKRFYELFKTEGNKPDKIHKNKLYSIPKG